MIIFSSIFALIVGAGMIGQWIILLMTKQVPELRTEPLRIYLHLVAEFSTALVLLIGGAGLLTHRPWGFWLYMLAMGMLLYTLIVSSGYFAHKRNWAFVGMFAIIFLLTLVSIVLVV